MMNGSFYMAQHGALAGAAQAKAGGGTRREHEVTNNILQKKIGRQGTTTTSHCKGWGGRLNRVAHRA